ncbi:hypothetical protein WN48_02886 [Eufriesea mexicana]|uniref:Uncharacterized protein n=1 Tax=Eufriesea mexicana TaxID=516756 RepID=A0A310SPZ1_9HYME|nr:hypothetical protein WN48_02886 [Eufriesea mexicana]
MRTGQDVHDFHIREVRFDIKIFGSYHNEKGSNLGAGKYFGDPSFGYCMRTGQEVDDFRIGEVKRGEKKTWINLGQATPCYPLSSHSTRLLLIISANGNGGSSIIHFVSWKDPSGDDYVCLLDLLIETTKRQSRGKSKGEQSVWLAARALPIGSEERLVDKATSRSRKFLAIFVD